MGLTGEGTSADDLWELRSREAIATTSATSPTSGSAAKAAEVGEEDWKTVERLVLIRTIDSLWVEHLTELDDMRRGIGLRGYAQQDPLNEFKREAFQLYDELRGLIRHGVASSIFRVTVTRQPAGAAGRDPAVAASLARGAAALAGGNGSNGSRPGRGAGAPRGAGDLVAAGATTASAGGGAILRGGPAAPAPRPMRESLGDEPRRERRRLRRVGRRTEARVHPDRRPDRAQRPVLVRVGREVQEVPRSLTTPRPLDQRPCPVRRRSVARDLGRVARARSRRPRRPGRVHDLPDLGAGPARRAAAGGRHRGHGRRPVRRAAVTDLRGAARPRRRRSISRASRRPSS